MRVFLTGATGVMGSAGLKELLKFPQNYEIKVLVRASSVNRKKMREPVKSGVKVIWGDLLDKNKIKEGIKDADIVLHVGGLVSPLADRFPEKTKEINIGSMRLIANAVKEIEDKDPDRCIKVVYIGSVSQYGSKLPPHHWGKVGDLQQAAKLDAYAESKITAEKLLREASLKKWVSLRQTAILHDGLLKKGLDPITFHVPLHGVLEWVTVEDSGRLLEKICRNDIPDSFWNKAYNVGGGESYRLTNLEFERAILKTLGCPPPEKIFETNWFATQNFHGVWFEDSDQLDEILSYRNKESFEEALLRMQNSLPFYFKLIPFVPAQLIKSFMKKIAGKAPLGPLSWIHNKDGARIEAAWGSLEEYERIAGWDAIEEPKLNRKRPD